MRGEAEGAIEETKDAIIVFWREEIRRAEEFVAARINFHKDQATKEDLELPHYLRRLRLKEVFTPSEQYRLSISR